MKLTRTTLLPCLLFASLFAVPTIAEEVSSPAAPAPVAPAVKSDTSILRRTPSLDGTIEPGEWDTYFQAQQEGFSATAFANWDETGLYIAEQGNKPTDMMITLDANNDGWFHGNDNYLIKSTNNQEGKLVVTLERYDSQGKMPTPGATETLDITGIMFKGETKPDSSVLEMRVPASAIQGLKPRLNANVGLRVALKPMGEGTAWTPMATLGDVEACCLAEKKVAAMDQLDVSLMLQDNRVVAGQKLMAKLFVKNASAHQMPIESFVVGGDGRAAKYLNSQRVRVEGLEAGKTMKHRFDSKIPEGMPVGSWAIGVEVRSGADGSRAGAALASFEVVKPYEISMDVGDDPLTVGVDRSRTIKINIKNQTPDPILGSVVVSIPEGWRMKPNILVRKFQVTAEDLSTSVRFQLIPPADAKAGEVPIKADVTIDGQVLSVGKNLEVSAAPAK